VLDRVRIPLILSLITVTGCAGTDLVAQGTICGQPFSVQLADRKDRSGFTAVAKCPDGGELSITSSDSSTSAVIATQAELAAQLSQVIADLASRP
jgi:hypothetical protein